MFNNSKEEECDISQIYRDNKTEDACVNKTKNPIFRPSSDASILGTNAQSNIQITNLPKRAQELTYINQDNIMPFDETEIEIQANCAICNKLIQKGDITYYCDCNNFIHSNCILKNQVNNIIQRCKNCNQNFKKGIFYLNKPQNTLNTGLRLKTKSTNINSVINNSMSNEFISYNKSREICSINSSKQDLVNDKSKICRDTNINELENYDILCDEASKIPFETMKEKIKQQKNENENEIQNTNIDNINISNNNQTNFDIISTLITNNNVNNKSRIALTPIEITNTPFIGTKKKRIIYNDINKNLQANFENSVNNYFRTEYKIKNKSKQKFNFMTDKKIKDEESINNDNNICINLTDVSNIINISNQSNANLSKESNSTLRNLNFSDITNQENDEENEEDKENCPPLLKENSQFPILNNNQENDIEEDENENNDNIEINISGAYSHISTEQKKTVEIPITIEIDTSKFKNVNYSKDTVIIINTNLFNIETILQIFSNFIPKMIDNDRVYCNILQNGQWLTKSEIISLIYNEENQMNNYCNVFKETDKLNYGKISELLDYGIEASLMSTSNIFSFLLINDIDEADDNFKYEIVKTVKKLEETQVNLLKYFSISTILLDNLGKTKTSGNIKFINYLYELSMMCMGFFYSPKNNDELIKSIVLFSANIEQYSILNVKLLIKGNQDPSIYLEALNYPLTKNNHNDLEIYIGSLLRKEKKIINLIASIIINNENINLMLPILEVSCEYYSKKNEIIYDENHNIISIDDNVYKARTEYYSLNIPVIPKIKKLQISYSVLFRNIVSKTAQRISKSIDLFKNFDYENSLKQIKEAKSNFENFINKQKGLLKKIGKYYKQQNNNMSFINFNNIDLGTLDYSQSFYNNQNISNCIDTNNENEQNLMQISCFIKAIINDLDICINIINEKNINNFCDLLIIQESLSFYRVVKLDDERFLEDNYAVTN